jgi:GNAT superfamily N-acetyltransferase
MTHTGLADGWAAGTPVGDNLVRAVTLSMADVGTGELLGHRTLVTEAYGAVDHGEPAGFANAVTLLQPLPYGRWEAVVGDLEDWCGFEGRPSGGERAGPTGEVLLFSAWPTPDLAGRGWVLHGHPPLMTRSAGPLPSLPAPDGLQIVPVSDERTLADFERTLVEAFPLADAGPLLPGGLFGPRLLDEPRWRMFVGYADGEPVATAGVFVEHGLNYVNYVATRAEWRGRGFGEALTWRATLADPSRPAALLASDPGRPVYERMGYRSLLRFTLWGRDRP